MVVNGTNFSVVGSGVLNCTVSGQYSAIVTGRSNKTCGCHAFIGNGHTQVASGDFSTIGSGCQNTIADAGNFGVLGGGS